MHGFGLEEYVIINSSGSRLRLFPRKRRSRKHSEQVVNDVETCDTELFSSLLIDPLNGGDVFLGPLEVVARYVRTEYPLCQVVVLEERGSGETDERFVG